MLTQTKPAEGLAEGLTVLVVPALELPRVETITRGLEPLQRLVDGRIEEFGLAVPGVAGICNEEFLFQGLPLNPNACLLRAPGVGLILGDVVIAGDGRDCFASVTRQHVEAVRRALGLPSIQGADTLC